ncbi:1,4-alpha-glucan branching enzyme, partial [Coprococcus eutactus]|nr:1,4-alpha-glucan branching enzyme [Coprococcus eutactus]
NGFDGSRKIHWSVLQFDAKSYFQKYDKEINKLYSSKTAFHGLADGNVEVSEDGQVMSFVRSGMRPDDVMYVVC